MTDFEKAFAAARRAGKKVFVFNGKLYNTKLKEEGDPTPDTLAEITGIKGLGADVKALIKSLFGKK